MTYNFNQPVAYRAEAKRAFHSRARATLRKLAHALRLAPGSYDIRSNAGGIAVSGEITLHHDRFYLQVSQSCIGQGMGVLVRTCRGRQDYVGGGNHWLPLAILDDLHALTKYVRRVQRADSGVSYRALSVRNVYGVEFCAECGGSPADHIDNCCPACVEG